MKLSIDGVIHLQDVPNKLLQKIKADLTIKNPDYIKKKRMGLNPYACGPQKIELWHEQIVDGKKEYILPRGYWWKFAGMDCIRENNTVCLPRLDFCSSIKLRNYQEDLLNGMMETPQGIGVAPCGSGKTETALELIARTGQPTLWITHTRDLVKQSMDRAISRLQLIGDQVGVIMAKTFKVGTHITFATVQTLSKRDLSVIIDKFGCIVVDECHHCFKDYTKSRMFESVISQFPAYYRYGITASEHRSDGLIETMYSIMGKKLYGVTQERVNKQGNVLVPKVYFVETGFVYEVPENKNGKMQKLNVQQLIGEMREDTSRNDLLLDCLRHQKPGDFVFALGDSLDHLSMFRDAVNKLETPAAFIHGKTPKKEREQVMNDVRQGKYTFLFATYSLAKEGLDIPLLNTLVLLTPKKDKAITQQSIGRIMRPLEGKKQPVVYDFWDNKVRQCQQWARERAKVYINLGAEVVGGPRVRVRRK